MWLVTKYRIEKSGPNHEQQNLTQSNQSNVKPTQFGTKVWRSNNNYCVPHHNCKMVLGLGFTKISVLNNYKKSNIVAAISHIRG